MKGICYRGKKCKQRLAYSRDTVLQSAMFKMADLQAVASIRYPRGEVGFDQRYLSDERLVHILHIRFRFSPNHPLC